MNEDGKRGYFSGADYILVVLSCLHSFHIATIKYIKLLILEKIITFKLLKVIGERMTYQTNIIISDRELWERFKDAAKEQGYTTSGGLEKALQTFINASSPRTRQQIRISTILKNCPPTCKIYEKALFNIVNREEFVSLRSFESILEELVYRKIITIENKSGQREITFLDHREIVLFKEAEE